MNDNIMITDMYWHGIYLEISMEGAKERPFGLYISDLKGEQYFLGEGGEHVTVNIVNIPQKKLLENGKWYFLAEHNGEFRIIKITSQCGYKLEELDKVYRYGREVYAYVVTFSAKDCREAAEDEEGMTCVMHTSYMMLNKKNDGRNIRVESKNLIQFAKKVMFIILKKGIDTAYHILAFLRRKDGKHILLMSETRTPIGGNLKALDDRLKERGLDQTYKISYSFSRTLQQSKWKTLLAWSRLLWLTAKQDIIFVDDYVPIFKTIHLTKDTRLVQLWHAGVGFKSVGYSRFGKAGSPLPLDSCHRQYDYAVVGGEGLREVYEEVFGIPRERILPYGLARLDGYMEHGRIENFKKTFYEKYPGLKGKKIIMFAPTYRGKTQDEAYYPADWVDQEKVQEICGDEYAFVYKMHPFITEKTVIDPKYRDCIYDLSEESDINALFYVTDILITDFSSNIYEFSLQRKPIIFYAPDKDFYQLTRGVHRTLDEAPGVVCTTFDEVAQVIRTKSFEIEKVERFVQESFDHQDKFAADHLIDDLIMKEEELSD